MKVEHINKVSTSGYPHDKVYDVTDMKARMKDPTTGDWVDAVIYTDGERSFIREKNDFLNKFKVVEDLSMKYFLEYLIVNKEATGGVWERLDLREWDNYDDAYVARCETQKVVNDRYIRVSNTGK